MRPTNLQFRSPNEATAEYNLPTVNNEGRKLTFPTPKARFLGQKRCTFSQAPRFLHYHDLQNRTTSLVGPGTYDSHAAKVRLLAKACMAQYVISLT